MIWIVIIGVAAQLSLQYVSDMTIPNLLPRNWGIAFRFKLATNLIIRFMWNIICAIPISMFIGLSGLYASIIFLIANVIYEGICLLWLHNKWIKEYYNYLTLKKEGILKVKNSIRKEIRKAAKDEQVVVTIEELEELADTIFEESYPELHKRLNQEQEKIQNRESILKNIKEKAKARVQ